MSENVSSAATTESAASTASESTASSSPVDTASVAASVMADMEGDTSEGESRPTPVEAATTTEAAPVIQTDTPPVDPDDFDAVPAEKIDAMGRKRENAIPHSRVNKMIERKVAKAKESWEAEVAPIRAEVTATKTKLKEYDDLGAIMNTEPERFIRMLVDAIPEYRKYVEPQTAAAPQTTVAAADDPEPEPDYDLGDGRKTYSYEGLRKRDEWVERRITRQIENKLGERLKPIEDERKAAADRHRAEQLEQQATEKVTQTLERARKWPNFTENEGDILKALQADKTLSLHDAYIQVVVPKLNADRGKLREEVVAEINALPRTTSTPTTAAAAKPPAGPRSTADIAREVAKEFGQAA